MILNNIQWPLWYTNKRYRATSTCVLFVACCVCSVSLVVLSCVVLCVGCVFCVRVLCVEVVCCALSAACVSIVLWTVLEHAYSVKHKPHTHRPPIKRRRHNTQQLHQHSYITNQTTLWTLHTKKQKQQRTCTVTNIHSTNTAQHNTTTQQTTAHLRVWCDYADVEWIVQIRIAKQNRHHSWSKSLIVRPGWTKQTQKQNNNNEHNAHHCTAYKPQTRTYIPLYIYTPTAQTQHNTTPQQNTNNNITQHYKTSHNTIQQQPPTTTNNNTTTQ